MDTPTYTDSPPPPRRRGGSGPRNPWYIKIKSLPIGGWFVLPKKNRGQVTQWAQRAGVKCQTYSSQGDPAKGIERGAVVVLRVE